MDPDCGRAFSPFRRPDSAEVEAVVGVPALVPVDDDDVAGIVNNGLSAY